MGSELKTIMMAMRASRVLMPYLRKVLRWFRRIRRKIKGKNISATIKIAVFAAIIYYLFVSELDMSLLLETWNQPVGFIQRIINMCVNLSKQIIEIFLGFNLKQYLLLFSWFIIRKII